MVGTAVVVAGGLLAFWKFHIFSERAARLVFKVDLVVRLEHEGHHICELIADVENVGNVGVEIDEFKFSLYGLKASDKIDETDEAVGFAVKFPTLIKRGTWLERSYVEPKSPQQYSHVCAIPAGFMAVLAFGRLKYADSSSKSDQTAQKVVSLVLPRATAAA
jgi:hypothetical protein